MKELWEKIKEALTSALPVTAIVYVLAMTPLFDLSSTELITFTIGAVMLILGGAILLVLGLIGEYVGRIFMCTNAAPQFVIRQIVFSKEGSRELCEK